MKITPWLASFKAHLFGSNPFQLSGPRRRPRSGRESIERLEDRTLLAVTALGPEIPVTNQTLGDQSVFAETPNSVAVDADGDFVVVWSSYGQDGSGNSIFARMFNSSGVAQGKEFQVNTETLGNQVGAAVAMDADGDFVVVWTSYYDQDGDGAGVFAQRFNADGVSQGDEFQVNTTIDGDQKFGNVAMDDSGDFVVTWTMYDGSGYGVYAQRYNALGVEQGIEFPVNNNTVNDQQFSRVSMDADGDFVVTWETYGQDGSGYGIYARRFEADGDPIANEFRVNGSVNGDQISPSIAVDDSGDFVVSWSSGDGSFFGIFARRFSSAGAALGGEFRVNNPILNDQQFSSVSVDADGDFVVSWTSYAQDTGGSTGVYARAFFSSGVAFGNEFRVNTTLPDIQIFPSVALDADGDFVVNWESYGQDGSGYGIYAQRFSLANIAPVNTVPGTQTTPVNTQKVFSGASGNRISVSDVDAGGAVIQVTLSVTVGNLTLGSVGGLSFAAGDGTSDPIMTFSGTIANINTAMNGLRYTPPGGFNGTPTLTITTNDLGNSGLGGPKTDTDTVAIVVGSGSTTTVTFNPTSKTLTVTSTASDSIAISSSGGNVVVTINGVNDPSVSAVPASTVQSIVVSGGPGANVINLSGVTAAAYTTLSSVLINGNDGNDNIVGTFRTDLIVGGPGNDYLNAAGGNDNVQGGAGRDTVIAGAGADTVTGDADNDSLIGQGGGDSLTGGDGNDTIDGGVSNDTLFGGLGDDSLLGGDNNDILTGDDGNDTLKGGLGNDILSAGLGNDGMDGGAGDDRMNGGAGNDSMVGGLGNDTLRGANGVDILLGNDGDDNLDGEGTSGDTLSGGAGNDTLNLNGGTDIQDEMFVLNVPWLDG